MFIAAAGPELKTVQPREPFLSYEANVKIGRDSAKLCHQKNMGAVYPATAPIVAYASQLKEEPRSQLHQSWKAESPGDLSGSRTIRREIRTIELRRVEGIQGLSAELSIDPLGESEVFVQRQIGVQISRPIAVYCAR